MKFTRWTPRSNRGVTMIALNICFSLPFCTATIHTEEMNRTHYLWLECIALFGLLPIPLYYLVLTPAADFPMDLGGFEPRRMLFPLAWLMAIVMMVRFVRKYPQRKIFPKIHWPDFKKHVLPRFILSACIMGVMVYLLEEARFLQFPRERTEIWAIIMVAYPLISVIPQEVIFRLFFFERYAPIFKGEWPMILASGLAFGHAHLMFNNNIAYFLSIAGGILFSMTYTKTRNLTLVWLEHALYGQFIFTVGLGWYFFTGAAASHG